METIRRIRDWITTIPTLVAFGSVMLVVDPILRVARLWGERAESVVAQLAQASLLPVFRLSGTKVRVERSAEIVPGESYVLVSNHQSMLDIPLIGGKLRANFPKFVAKRELSRWIPTVSYNLRRGGHLIIDRMKGKEAVDKLAVFAKRTRATQSSPVIFVEGSRSRDGQLKEFKRGGLAALLEHAPDMRVVPVAIDGSWQVLKDRFLPIPWGVELRVRFMAPIERSESETVERVLAEVRMQIQGALDEWRMGAAPA